jgi:hypothetical protein
VLGVAEMEEMVLPVALHSPLEVLKEQMQDITNILMTDQVLILCDLNDPERNNDRLLSGMVRVYFYMPLCALAVLDLG